MNERQSRRAPLMAPSWVNNLWPPEIWPRILIFACLVVVTLIFMVALRRHYEFPKSFSFRMFTLLATMTWWAALSRVKTSPNPFAPAFALWILGAGLSILAGVNMAESLDVLSIIDLITCFFFLHIVINTFNRVRHLKQAVYVLAFAVIPASIYGFLQYTNRDPWGLVTNRVPVSTLGNQNYATYIHDIALPIEMSFLVFLLISTWSYMQTLQPDERRKLSPHSPAHPLALALVLFYLAVGYFHMAKCNSNGNWVAIRLAAYGMAAALFLFWSPPREWKRVPPVIQLIVVAVVGVVVAFITGLVEGWSDGVMLGLAMAAITGITLFWSLPRFFRIDEVPEEERPALIARRANLRRIGVAVALVFFLLGAFTFSQTDRFAAMWNKNSNKFRRDIWAGTLEKIKTNALLGIGPHNFKIVHPLYETTRERIVLGTEVLGRTAHNDYLEKISEGGFIAALGIFWMQVVLVWLLWCNMRDLQSLRDRLDLGRAPPVLAPKLERFYLFGFWLALGQTGAIIALGFHSHVEESFRQPASVVLFTFVLGTVVALRRLIRRAVGVDMSTIYTPQSAPRTTLGGIFPVLNQPELRWALVPIIALLIYTPTLKQFLAEALVRKGMGSHEAAEYYRDAKQYAVADQADAEMFNLFRQANKLYPWYMEDYYILGRYCIDTAEYEKGVEVLLRDIWMNPNYKWAHNNIGVCYDRLATDMSLSEEERALHTQNARLHYYAALEIDPRQIYALYNLGVGYMRTEDYWPAIVKFTESLAVDSKKSDAYRFRSIAWEFLAEKELNPVKRAQFQKHAHSDLQKYVSGTSSLSYMDSQLILQLAASYIQAGSFTEALPLLEKAELIAKEVESQGGNASSDLMRVAGFYSLGGHGDRAIAILESLTVKYPQNSEAWYDLAANLSMRDPIPFDRVFQALRSAFRINPELVNRVLKEPVFQPLLENPDFKELMKVFRP